MKQWRGPGQPTANWVTANCGVCAFADDYAGDGDDNYVGGYWPDDAPGRSHCRGCHRSWNGLAEAHCVRCHHHFTSGGAADVHWQGANCVDPATVKTKKGEPKLVVHPSPFGDIWSRPGPAEPWANRPADDADIR